MLINLHIMINLYQVVSLDTNFTHALLPNINSSQLLIVIICITNCCSLRKKNMFTRKLLWIIFHIDDNN